MQSSDYQSGLVLCRAAKVDLIALAQDLRQRLAHINVRIKTVCAQEIALGTDDFVMHLSLETGVPSLAANTNPRKLMLRLTGKTGCEPEENDTQLAAILFLLAQIYPCSHVHWLSREVSLPVADFLHTLASAQDLRKVELRHPRITRAARTPRPARSDPTCQPRQIVQFRLHHAFRDEVTKAELFAEFGLGQIMTRSPIALVR